MRIAVAIPEAHVEAPVLDAALEATTRLNEQMIARGDAPTFDRALAAGVRWKPEPPGDERFDHASTVVARKWGDCDDLAPYHAATLRHTGEDEEATAIVRRSGPKRWHAVVQRSDGSIDDPSVWAGMGGGKPRGNYGAAIPLMSAPSSVVGGTYLVRPQIAMRPVRGAFQARADLPWNWREKLDEKPSPTDYAMTSLHTAPIASSALTGAIDGIIDLGICSGIADPDHVRRLSAIADRVDGVPHREVRGIYGADHADAASHVVGAFFGRGSVLLGAGQTIVISPQEAARSALKAFDAPGSTDDAKRLAQLVHKNAAGKRPDADSLMGAVLKYLDTTMGPTRKNSADEHARLLIADQTAKRLIQDPWFQKELAKASLNGPASVDGLFDSIGKAIGGIGKAVGSVVAKVAPVVATVAPFIPVIGPAISGAASLAAVATKALSPRAAPQPATPPARPVAPAVRAATSYRAPSAPAPAYRAPSPPAPAAAPTTSKLVPGGVPGSSAVHQGQLFHLTPFG